MSFSGGDDKHQSGCFLRERPWEYSGDGKPSLPGILFLKGEMMSVWNEIEIICPFCKKNFLIEMSLDRQGVKSYKKIPKNPPVKHYK